MEAAKEAPSDALVMETFRLAHFAAVANPAVHAMAEGPFMMQSFVPPPADYNHMDAENYFDDDMQLQKSQQQPRPPYQLQRDNPDHAAVFRLMPQGCLSRPFVSPISADTLDALWKQWQSSAICGATHQKKDVPAANRPRTVGAEEEMPGMQVPIEKLDTLFTNRHFRAKKKRKGMTRILYL